MNFINQNRNHSQNHHKKLIKRHRAKPIPYIWSVFRASKKQKQKNHSLRLTAIINHFLMRRSLAINDLKEPGN